MAACQRHLFRSRQHVLNTCVVVTPPGRPVIGVKPGLPEVARPAVAARPDRDACGSRARTPRSGRCSRSRRRRSAASFRIEPDRARTPHPAAHVPAAADTDPTPSTLRSSVNQALWLMPAQRHSRSSYGIARYSASLREVLWTLWQRPTVRMVVPCSAARVRIDMGLV